MRLTWASVWRFISGIFSRPNPTPQPQPQPSPEDDILRSVTWVHGGGQDISKWPVNCTLGKVEIKLPHICSTGVSWPATWPEYGAKKVQANHVVIAQIDGKWYGGAWEALNLRAANTCRVLECMVLDNPNGYGPFGQVEKPPFWFYRPQSGDKIGFMVTSWIRSHVAQPVGRSEVYWTVWP